MPVLRVQGSGGGNQWKRFVIDDCCPPIVASFAELLAPTPGIVPTASTDRLVVPLPADSVSQFVLGVDKMEDPAPLGGASVQVRQIPATPPVGAVPTLFALAFTPGRAGQYSLLQVDLNAAGGNVGDFFDLILTNECGCYVNVTLEITPAIP